MTTLPRRWIYVCIGLLTVNAGVMAILIVASARSAPTVVPHYYERAVDWDRTMAEERAMERLGWKVELSLAQAGATVTLHTASGQPLDGATVSLSGFPRAHPALRLQLEQVTGGDGRAQLAAPQPLLAGWYELDLTVTRGPVRISLHRAVELPGEVVAAQEQQP